MKQKACLSSYVGGISPNMRGQLEEAQNRTLSRGRAGRGSRRRNVSLPGVMCPLLYSRRNWLTTGTRLRVSMLLGSNRKRGNPSHLNRFEVGRSVLTYLNLPLGTSQWWEHRKRGSDMLAGDFSSRWTWLKDKSGVRGPPVNTRPGISSQGTERTWAGSEAP